MELTVTANQVDFSGVAKVNVDEVQTKGGELVVTVDTGEVWRMTPGPDWAIIEVPR